MTDTVARLDILGAAPASPGQPPVVLVGSGQLHATLATALGQRCQFMTIDDLLGDHTGAALVVASDANDTRAYPVLHRWAGQQGIPWLGVRTEADWVLLGPAVLPGEPGCPTCVARRRAANRSDAKARLILHQQYGADIATTQSVLVTPLVAKTVTALVTDEVQRLIHDRDTARTHGALLCLSMHSGTLACHQLLPDPLCPSCATIPEDTAAAAVIRLRRLPKPDPGLFRIGELSSRQAELEQMYVDAETGVIASLSSGSHYGSPIAVARLSPAWAKHDSRHGYGRSSDFRSATLTAITEALERMASTHPRGRRTSVRAAYVEIAQRALDPHTLGLYPDAWYDRTGFRYARFHPAKQLSWVWGYSFARAEPLLVPQTYAYHGAERKDDPGFAYECSNGCALGSCLEEAILHGLLEIAERDAFLMTWYARIPASKIDLHSTRDRRIPVTAEMIRHRHGYEIMAFNITLEQRIPAFWIMAIDRVGGFDRPWVMCGAAAHPDAERALRNALHEVGHAVSGLVTRYNPNTAASMFTNPDLVVGMDDHAMLYGHPDAFARLDFLSADGPTRPLSDFADQWAWSRHGDLDQDLAELIGRYLASGLDVIAVDTTSPELRAGGFACAKLIVPGTVPMTFGHRYRRTHGLTRLTTVPRLLGYRRTELRVEELNPFPHPFP
jgi:ribosomal protein S12 methylthiotransferase accessory factor